MKKCKSFILTVTVLTGTLVYAGTAYGQAEQLILTESSSTSLTATLDGAPLTVLNPSPDHWLVGLQGVTGAAAFAEPESSTEANLVMGDPSTAFVDMTVVSDDPIAGVAFFPNGETNLTAFHLVTGAPLDVTFNDLGDGRTSIPDTASTLGILGVSVAAMLGLRRRIVDAPIKT